MLVDVLALGRVVLYHSFRLIKEHIFDGAHLLPGRARLSGFVPRAYTDVFPALAVGCDNMEGFPADVDLENAVSSVSVPAITSPLRLPISVLIQSVQVFRCYSPFPIMSTSFFTPFFPM